MSQGHSPAVGRGMMAPPCAVPGCRRCTTTQLPLGPGGRGSTPAECPLVLATLVSPGPHGRDGPEGALLTQGHRDVSVAADGVTSVGTDVPPLATRSCARPTCCISAGTCEPTLGVVTSEFSGRSQDSWPAPPASGSRGRHHLCARARVSRLDGYVSVTHGPRDGTDRNATGSHRSA